MVALYSSQPLYSVSFPSGECECASTYCTALISRRKTKETGPIHIHTLPAHWPPTTMIVGTHRVFPMRSDTSSAYRLNGSPRPLVFIEINSDMFDTRVISVIIQMFTRHLPSVLSNRHLNPIFIIEINKAC